MFRATPGKIPEFQILGWSQNVTIPDDAAIPMCFKFEFHLVRKAQYYYLKVLLPLWLLVITSVSAFGIEPEDLSGRLQVLVTLLLSTIAFLYVVQESVPKINHLTVIDKVVIASLGAVSFILSQKSGVYNSSTTYTLHTAHPSLSNLKLMLSVLASFLVSIAPAESARELNAILAAGYQSLYILANLLLIVPPHRRHVKLRAALVSKQETQDFTKSGRFLSKQRLASFGADKPKLRKSYDLSGDGGLALRGDDSLDRLDLKADHFTRSARSERNTSGGGLVALRGDNSFDRLDPPNPKNDRRQQQQQQQQEELIGTSGGGMALDDDDSMDGLESLMSLHA